ncbi:NAD-dependent epimerase/dehydratase family protein, partial [bacterium]|nr:NAD-dependent epimerase/dehydratase family protein [bacterium]
MIDSYDKVVVKPQRPLNAALSAGKRVVVTGCAGFIGSHLTEALLDLGCRVPLPNSMDTVLRLFLEFVRVIQ